MRLSSIDRCHYIMRWIHQEGPGQKRTATAIAEQLDLPLASVTACMRQWSECFTRTPGVGYSLSGKFPEGVEVDLNHPRVKVHVPVVFDNSQPGKWVWNEGAVKFLDEMLTSYFGSGLKTTFRNCSKEDAYLMMNTGKTLTEIFKRLIAADVIGRSAQEEWSPFT